MLWLRLIIELLAARHDVYKVYVINRNRQLLKTAVNTAKLSTNQ